MPHVTMMRAIHRRAPTRSRMRLLGTSNRKYPMKKMPAPKPYTASEYARSAAICNLAKPMFTRSRYATM
jgi:hypothetical protein